MLQDNTTAAASQEPFLLKWRPVAFFLCHTIAGFLIITWFWEPVQSYWGSIDEAAFIAMNGWLLHNIEWQKPLAFANSKLYDKLSALFLLALMMIYVVFGWGEDMGKRFAVAIFISLFMFIVVNLRREMGWLEYARPSPTLVADYYVDLREKYPALKPKISSGSSFPGDHAISCFIFISLFWYFAGAKAGLVALAASPLFVMPRMMVGAHWLSDSIIGGLAFTLIAVAWAICTPLAGFVCNKLHAVIRMAHMKTAPYTRKFYPPPV